MRWRDTLLLLGQRKERAAGMCTTQQTACISLHIGSMLVLFGRVWAPTAQPPTVAEATTQASHKEAAYTHM